MFPLSISGLFLSNQLGFVWKFGDNRPNVHGRLLDNLAQWLAGRICRLFVLCGSRVSKMAWQWQCFLHIFLLLVFIWEPTLSQRIFIVLYLFEITALFWWPLLLKNPKNASISRLRCLWSIYSWFVFMMAFHLLGTGGSFMFFPWSPWYCWGSTCAPNEKWRTFRCCNCNVVAWLLLAIHCTQNRNMARPPFVIIHEKYVN